MDLERFAPGSGSEARDRLGLPVQASILLSPRAVAPLYNQQTILAAFDRLAATREDVHLVLKHLGDAPPVVPSRYRERVHVIGHLDAARLPDVYRAADVAISIPSSDSAPRSVWEAMACGTPCVLSDLPWLDGMVSRDEAEVVPVEADAVAAAAARLLDNPEHAAAVAERARARVVAEHDPDVQLERLLALYEQLAATSRSSSRM